MSCFLCASVGNMAVAAEASNEALGAHGVIIAGFLLGCSITQLPKPARDGAMAVICEDHLAIMRSAIEQASKLGSGLPEFEFMKPYLLRSVPPRLKQVK